MILNVVKTANRDFIDVRDLKASLLILSNATKADTPTIATIVKFIDFVDEVFSKQQPRADTVTPTLVIEYNLFDELNKCYKKNVKKEKKKKKRGETEIEGLVSLEPPNPVEEGFDAKQLKELKELSQEQSELMQKLLIELVKAIKSPAAKEEIGEGSKGSKKKSTA